MTKVISFSREMTDEQYKAFEIALQLEEKTQDEYFAEWISSAIEGTLDTHPYRREELLKIWGAGLK